MTVYRTKSILVILVATSTVVASCCSCDAQIQKVQSRKLATSPNTAIAEKEPKDSPPIDLVASVTLRGMGVRESYGHSFGTIDLGTLNPMTSYRLTLTVINSGFQDIAFDRVAPSCKCSAVSPSAGKIAKGDQAQFVVDFKTLQSNIYSQFAFDTQLLLNQKNEVLLSFSGNLAGNLYMNPRNGFLFNEGISEYSIPFAFTNPISFDALTVEFSKSIRDKLVAELVRQTETSGNLIVLLNSDGIAGDFLAGRLTLKDEKVNKSTSTDIVFRKKWIFSISPRVIRFFENPSRPETRQATALLQIDEKHCPIGDTLPSVSCNLGNERIDIRCVMLKKGIYRLNLSTSNQDLKREDQELSFRISTRDLERTLKLNAIYERK